MSLRTTDGGLDLGKSPIVSAGIDYFLFAGLSVALFVLLHVVVTSARRLITWMTWGLLALILSIGWFAVEDAGRRAQRRVEGMVSGYAPTYAAELTRMGHADLPLDASPDDPSYLAMIQAQIRWLRANPGISDVYTFRRLPDGRVVLVVDSETDYDGNGVYEGERESRTAIGEVYDLQDEHLMRAFEGHAGFADEPMHDRWGVWVSAFVPMYDREGNVEAVLGVDFDAERWLAEIQRARLTAIGYLVLLVVLVAAGGTFMRYLDGATQRALDAEAACHVSESRLRMMVEHLPAGAIHREGDRLTVNKAVERITGYARDRLAHIDAWFTQLYGPQAGEIRAAYEEHRQVGFIDPTVVTLTRANGVQRDVEFASYRYSGGEIWLMNDVTERIRSEAILRHQSLHDGLTGLPNRAQMLQRLDECLAKARLQEGFSFALLFLDLDRFKLINDTLGHVAGDEFIVTVAQRLERCLDSIAATEPVGDAHMLARMGGDEFTIVLEGVREAAAAMRVADRLLRTMEAPVILSGQEAFPTVSIGVALYEPGCTIAADMLRDADTAMYHAKADGKARAALFDRAMRERVVARVAMESDLRRALERGELSLAYQPIVRLESGDLSGFEALLRWRHPVRGLVSPAEFVPLAEETGLILQIGQWALEEASRQLVQWQQRCPEARGLSMSVNLSRRQLAQVDLADRISQVIRETGIRAGDLTIEITENIVMSDLESGIAALHRLRGLGVRLAMDDFGTGYSSLSCLHRFPLDVLKIDRSFITNMSARREYAAVINAIVALSHNMNMRVTAEGVEKLEQLAQLQTLECDLAQGYYFAKPLPAEEAEAFIRRGAQARVA